MTHAPLTRVNWEAPPFSWLKLEHQNQIKTQATSRSFALGEVIWSTDAPGSHFLVVSGNVRLVPAEGDAVRLKEGDWFGDALELSDAWKARAASKEVVLLEWSTADWSAVTSAEMRQFWTSVRSRYQPNFSNAPQPVSGYPFVSGLNTAAACLTMLAQRLETPVQPEWVQRQLRGQRPKDLINAGEK